MSTDLETAVVGPSRKRSGLMATAKELNVVQILTGLVLTLSMTIGSLGLWIAKGVLARVDQMEERQAATAIWIAETNGNRFTAIDGAKVWESIARMQADSAKMQTELALSNAQTRESLTEIKATLRDIDSRLREAERKKQ